MDCTLQNMGQGSCALTSSDKLSLVDERQSGKKTLILRHVADMLPDERNCYEHVKLSTALSLKVVLIARKDFPH